VTWPVTALELVIVRGDPQLVVRCSMRRVWERSRSTTEMASGSTTTNRVPPRSKLSVGLVSRIDVCLILPGSVGRRIRVTEIGSAIS
jgi:hypothetical protein